MKTLNNFLKEKGINRFIVALLLTISSLLVHAQIGLNLPPIEGGPCDWCVAPGWSIIKSSPDLVFGNGPHPNSSLLVVGGIEGPSPLGGSMALCGGYSGVVGESMQTVVSGLSPNTSYFFTIYWNPITIDAPSDPTVYARGGGLAVKVNGDLFDGSASYFTAGTQSWNKVNYTFTTGAGETTATISLGIDTRDATGQVTSTIQKYGYIAIDAGAPDVPPCSAGTTQVSLNGSTLSNICPSNTVNLNSLVNSTAPTGSGLVWFNNANHTGAAYATPATAGAGTYFAFFYDATNNCYNGAASTASVTVTINGCTTCPSTAPVLSGTSAIICPGSGGAVNLNNFVSSTTPAGAALVWKDGSGTTISNTTAVSTAGVYTATYFNASLNCSSPASAGITLAFLPNPVPTASTINICSPATTANLTNVVTAPNGSGYVIEWYDGVNFNLQTPAQLAAEPPGDYYVYFRSGATCYNNADIMVTVTNNPAACTVCPTAPALSAVTQPTCTVATGSFTITNFNSSFTYTVNPSTGVTVTGSSITAPAGSYTVTASSGACTPAVSASVTVNTQPATPAAAATGTVTQPVCPVTTGSVALSGLPSAGNWTITITPAVATATGVSGSGTTTTIANLPAGTYTFKVTNSTGCVSVSSSSVVINNVNCTVTGTIDCNKTRLVPSPVAGTASQVDLAVTVNITATGCFTPIAVSGSGFSIASGITQVCATRLGVQEFHIPVNYDGSVLSSLNFSVGQAGGCVADLTKPPKKKEVAVWTLDNCTPPNIAPVLR